MTLFNMQLMLINICEGVYKIPRQVWWGANYYCHYLPQTNKLVCLG